MTERDPIEEEEVRVGEVKAIRASGRCRKGRVSLSAYPFTIHHSPFPTWW